MSACQLMFLEDSPRGVLLDIIPLETLAIDGTVVPPGLPLSVSFLPSADRRAHGDMVALFDRWLADNRVLDLDVGVATEIGGLRYVFTLDDEQLVLDVRA
ncbi:MAG TPA: hypothetical protein VFZ68_13325 [Acidimicrobiales bacterium]